MWQISNFSGCDTWPECLTIAPQRSAYLAGYPNPVHREGLTGVGEMWSGRIWRRLRCQRPCGMRKPLARWRTTYREAIDRDHDRGEQHVSEGLSEPAHRVQCLLCMRSFRREGDKKRHKCISERQKPIREQQGGSQCLIWLWVMVSKSWRTRSTPMPANPTLNASHTGLLSFAPPWRGSCDRLLATKQQERTGVWAWASIFLSVVTC